jgi:phosphoribosylanthranilate isomerase
MSHPENIADLIKIGPDFIGFIFYKKSFRYVLGNESHLPAIKNLDFGKIKKVGVFVNESTSAILDLTKEFGLNTVQLHGEETPETCKILKDAGLEVWKAVPIGSEADFGALIPYQKHVNAFLFDTKSEKIGGSGLTFDWSLLEAYRLDTPFFLAGGLDIENIKLAKSVIKHKKLLGFDLNSRFEKTPGFKNIELLQKAFLKIRK